MAKAIGYIAVIVALMALVLSPIPAVSGSLDDFENNLESDDNSDSDSHHRDHHHRGHHDHDDDDDGGLVQILIDIIFYSSIEGSEGTVTQPQPTNLPGGNLPFHLSMGGSYMYVNPDLYSGGGWLRGWFGFASLGMDYVEFTETLDNGEYDVMGLGALRAGLGIPRTDRLTITWEALFRFIGESGTSAWGLGILADVTIVNPLFFELQTNVSFFPENPLWDLGGYLKLRYWVGVKAGYRSLIAGSSDLSGPEVGVMVEF